MPISDAAWLVLPEFVTAVLIAAAVIALFRLARAVSRGLDRTLGREHEPLVTVSLEPSTSDHDHVNLVIQNCGLTPAFDVKVVMTPEIPSNEGVDRPAGWHDVSLLRPSQAMVGYACRADRLTEQEIRVEVSWKKRPDVRKRIAIEYSLDMRRYPYQEPFAAPPERDELLYEFRSFRRDWRPMARGQQALQVDLSEKVLRAFLEASRAESRHASREESQRSRQAEPSQSSRKRERDRDAKSAPVGL